MALLFVTYYDDPRYPIGHTPEVCARQVGYTVERITTTTVDLSELGTDYQATKATVLDLQRGPERILVVYLICANGELCSDRERARWAVSRPGNRYSYVSKLEAHAAYEDYEKRPLALATCRKILSEAVPVLVKEHFPTRADLEGP
jgi:hypothetical protein